MYRNLFCSFFSIQYRGWHLKGSAQALGSRSEPASGQRPLDTQGRVQTVFVFDGAPSAAEGSPGDGAVCVVQVSVHELHASRHWNTL